MAFTIDNKQFKNKTTLIKYVQQKINNIGIAKIDNTNAHYNFFVELINMHPDKIDKIGTGIKCFELEQNKINKKCINQLIHRIDGSIISFSYKVCCNINIYNKNDLTNALRYAIYPQTHNYKINNILCCAICNTTDKNILYETDHIILFTQLKDDFLKITKHTIPTEFKKDSNNMTMFMNCDNSFKNEWINYHRKNCKLQILCKKCNMSKSKK